MADLEKVLNGLQHCIEKLDSVVGKPHGFDCISCSYFRKCESIGHLLGLPLMCDALALLKAQQPRVLTLDEVKASKGKDLILEYKPWGCEDSIVTAATIEGCGRKGVSFVMSVSCDYTAYNCKHTFGWRCWSARPTDAERKAVKWNERNLTESV